MKDLLPTFTTFQLKLAMKSSNGAKVPRISNLIAIANKKSDELKPLQALTVTVTRSSVAQGTPVNHIVPTDFKVQQGNAFLIDVDENSSYSGKGSVILVRGSDGSVTSSNTVANTGCTLTFTSTDGTRNFRAVVILFGK